MYLGKFRSVAQFECLIKPINFSVQNDRYVLSEAAMRDRFEAQKKRSKIEGMTTASADTARLFADRVPKHA